MKAVEGSGKEQAQAVRHEEEGFLFAGLRLPAVCERTESIPAVKSVKTLRGIASPPGCPLLGCKVRFQRSAGSTDWQLLRVVQYYNTVRCSTMQYNAVPEKEKQEVKKATWHIQLERPLERTPGLRQESKNRWPGILGAQLYSGHIRLQIIEALSQYSSSKSTRQKEKHISANRMGHVVTHVFLLVALCAKSAAENLHVISELDVLNQDITNPRIRSEYDGSFGTAKRHHLHHRAMEEQGLGQDKGGGKQILTAADRAKMIAKMKVCAASSCDFSSS